MSFTLRTLLSQHRQLDEAGELRSRDDFAPMGSGLQSFRRPSRSQMAARRAAWEAVKACTSSFSAKASDTWHTGQARACVLGGHGIWCIPAKPAVAWLLEADERQLNKQGLPVADCIVNASTAWRPSCEASASTGLLASDGQDMDPGCPCANAACGLLP